MKWVVYDADDDDKINEDDAVGSVSHTLAGLYDSMLQQHDPDNPMLPSNVEKNLPPLEDDAAIEAAEAAKQKAGRVTAEGVATHPLVDSQTGRFIIGVPNEHDLTGQVNEEADGLGDHSSVTISMCVRQPAEMRKLSPEEEAYHAMRERLKVFCNDDGRQFWTRGPDALDPSQTPLNNKDIDRIFDETDAGAGTFMVVRYLEQDKENVGRFASLDELIAAVNEWVEQEKADRAALLAFLRSDENIMFSPVGDGSQRRGSKSSNGSVFDNTDITPQHVDVIYQQVRAGASTLSHCVQLNRLLSRAVDHGDHQTSGKAAKRGASATVGAGSGLSVRSGFDGPTANEFIAELRDMHLRSQLDRDEVFNWLNNRGKGDNNGTKSEGDVPAEGTVGGEENADDADNADETDDADFYMAKMDGTICALFSHEDTRVSKQQVDKMFNQCNSNVFTLQYLQQLSRGAQHFDRATHKHQLQFPQKKLSSLMPVDLRDLTKAISAMHTQSFRDRDIVLRHLRNQRSRLTGEGQSPVPPMQLNDGAAAARTFNPDSVVAPPLTPAAQILLGGPNLFAKNITAADVDVIFYLSKAGASTLSYLKMADRLSLPVTELHGLQPHLPGEPQRSINFVKSMTQSLKSAAASGARKAVNNAANADLYSINAMVTWGSLQRAWVSVDQVVEFISAAHQRSLLERNVMFVEMTEAHAAQIARRERRGSSSRKPQVVDSSRGEAATPVVTIVEDESQSDDEAVGSVHEAETVVESAVKRRARRLRSSQRSHSPSARDRAARRAERDAAKNDIHHRRRHYKVTGQR